MRTRTDRRKRLTLLAFALLAGLGWITGQALRPAPEATEPPVEAGAGVTHAPRRLPAGAAGADDGSTVVTAATTAEPRGKGERAPPVYHPRAADEWQGMLVDLSMQASCDVAARCGLAMACHDGVCGPCASDSECSQGEVCVLDHCVAAAAAACRSRADCGGEALCVLSGYSSDPRGNGAMSSTCLEGKGGVARSRDIPVTPTIPATRVPDVDARDLLQALRDET